MPYLYPNEIEETKMHSLNDGNRMHVRKRPINDTIIKCLGKLPRVSQKTLQHFAVQVKI